MANGTLVGTGTIQPDEIDQKIEKANHLICKFDGHPFTDRQSVLDHFNERHPSEKVQRDISLFLIENPYHTDNRFLKEKFECEDCFKTFPSLPHLRQHQEGEHGKRTLPDPDASPKFVETEKSPKETRLKVQTLLKKGPIKPKRAVKDDDWDKTCNICKKSFKNCKCFTEGNKEETWKKIESEQAQCELCGQWFDNKRGVNTHKHRKHGEKKPTSEKATCEHCGKKFDTKYALNGHKNSGHREFNKSKNTKPMCELCNVTFDTKRALQSHNIQMHPKAKAEVERTVICDECGEAFVNERGLKVHQTTKHPVDNQEIDTEQSNICNICGDELKNWRGVKMHKYYKHGISENGEVSLEQCEICKSFVNNLEKHTKRLHKDLDSAKSDDSNQNQEEKAPLPEKNEPETFEEKLADARNKSKNRTYNAYGNFKNSFSPENSNPKLIGISTHLAPAQLIGIEQVIDEGWYTDRSELIRAAITKYLENFGIIGPHMRD